MLLADFIAANKTHIIESWRTRVESRLAIAIERSELVDDLPTFVDELAAALRLPVAQWPAMEGARSHGHHRMRIGVDIVGLTEEMLLVGETILDLANTIDVALSVDDVRQLTRAIGRGTAVSVHAYATLRDRELAAMAANHYAFIAHEIRTPLHTAQLTARLLVAGREENRPRYQARLERALQQVSELIDNSVVHARLQGNPNLVHRSSFAMKDVAEFVREELEDFAVSRGVFIAIDVDEIEMAADRRLVHSALTNLVRNGIKFSCAGSTVTLRVHAKEDRILFEVKDACGGIPSDVLAHLFQPFVQEHKDRSGFGLGLLIVKEAAEAHHGSVRIANRPEEGCTFIMDLPLQLREDNQKA